ncbi:MAG: hypothetical protein V3U78_05440 [Thiotrichaceae bacterium]
MRIGEGEDLEIKEHGLGSTLISLDEIEGEGVAQTIIYSSDEMQDIINMMIVNRDRMIKFEEGRR